MFEAHFQTFEEPEGGVALTARLAALREELARRKLTGFAIPRADQQQNEYVAASEERLAWLTGFTGSAGMAVVLTKEAAVFVDGRYTLQAAKQVDGKAWSVEPLVEPPPETWLEQHLVAGDRLGFDPWLHTSAAAERLAAACAKAGAELVAVDSNPLDSVWTERPAPPLGPVAIHGAQFSGEAEADKLGRIRGEIAKLGADALVLSDSHAVAWTFNIRGADVSHTPLPLSYALVPRDGRPTVFIDHRKLSNSARDHLEQNADVREPDALTPQLTELAQQGRIDRARQRHRRRCAEPADHRRRRQGLARQRSGGVAEGRQERHRDRGHPRRASARRRGAGALSGLDRPRGADRAR